MGPGFRRIAKNNGLLEKVKKFYVYVCQNWTSSAHIKSTVV
jgi:hypothetical protein